MRLLFAAGLIMSTLTKPLFAEPPARGPVVVELFESQGCSSCPPAERTMEVLEKEFGNRVVLLTWHVDYWDYLGWKDTFSDRRFTERQKFYAQVFHQESIYTPEMVVQGVAGFNGADLAEARRQVTWHVATARTFSLTVTRVGEKIKLSALLPPDLARGADVLAVVSEDANPVHVLKGENAGETMSGRFAVREMVALHPHTRNTYEASIPLNKAWNPAKLRVTVLVRNPSTPILAAATASDPIAPQHQTSTP